MAVRHAQARNKSGNLVARRHYTSGDDDWVQYFWAEQTVSREEYLANSGKEDCA